MTSSNTGIIYDKILVSLPVTTLECSGLHLLLMLNTLSYDGESVETCNHNIKCYIHVKDVKNLLWGETLRRELVQVGNMLRNQS